MSDLKSDYREIEKGLKWPEEPTGFMPSDQFYRLVKDLRTKVRERSLSEKLDTSIYEYRLYKLLDFVSDLRNALNSYPLHAHNEKKNEQHIWYHCADYKITDFVKVKGNDKPEIYREGLLKTAATYLANPWLQLDHIDWIFIDSLILAEISSYAELILTGQALGKVNWAYILSGGNIEKTYLFRLGQTLGVFALRYIAPSVVIFALYYFHHETASLITGILYAVYLLVHAVLWPIRYRKRKLEQKTLQEHLDRWQKMMIAYSYCKPPVISLETLRTNLNKAVEAGALFEGVLFSILKRIEETRGEAFMPFMESE